LATASIVISDNKQENISMYICHRYYISS